MDRFIAALGTLALLGSPLPFGGPSAEGLGSSPGPTAGAPPPTASPAPTPESEPAQTDADRVLRVQAALDRAHDSPGEIDGLSGANTRLALAAYTKAHGLASVDAARTALEQDPAPAVVTYTITPADVAGPFVKVPEDMMEKARLPSLGYGSAVEALGEKFHASPRLLRERNVGGAFKAGETIRVPNVRRAAVAGKAAKVVVDKSDLSVSALDAQGKVLARYPATMGSVHDPLPIGEWKVTAVQRNPKFHYNPDLFWDAEAKDEKATIAPGPNNPVGVVWMDLSKPHYGIHGTPEPSTIGKTQSHGCIRLTNWDAAELADIVSAGTPAVLQE
jgi:lipoprotein-anchoring transpeptidase ErfK/SrfK